MKGTAIQSSAVLLKNLTPTVKGKPFITTKPKAGANLFSEKLDHAFLNQKLVDQPGASNLKTILSMLVKALKQSLHGTGPASSVSEKASKIDQLLKKSVKLLQKKQTVDLPKDAGKQADANGVAQSLQLLVAAIGQFQQLMKSQIPASSSSESQQKEIGKLTSQLVKSIQQLLESLSPSGDSSGKKKAQNRGNSFFQSPVEFSKQLRAGTPAKQTDVQGNQQSPQQVQQQMKALGRSAPTSQSIPLAKGLKNVAASAFQRTVQPKDQKETQAQLNGGFSSGTMSRLQQFVVHVRQNGNAANQQQFIQDFERVLAKSTLTNIGGKQQLVLKLHPQSLGTLNIQLTRQDGQLTATFFASTASVKNLVESNLHQLQGAFMNQNLNVQKLQVMGPFVQQQPEQTPNYNQPQGDTPQHRQEPEPGQENEENNDEENHFTEWLEQLQLHSISEVGK